MKFVHALSPIGCLIPYGLLDLLRSLSLVLLYTERRSKIKNNIQIGAPTKNKRTSERMSVLFLPRAWHSNPAKFCGRKMNIGADKKRTPSGHPEGVRFAVFFALFFNKSGENLSPSASVLCKQNQKFLNPKSARPKPVFAINSSSQPLNDKSL